ncbi:MAG: VIT1/CCC1 transporter family protein [Candidatus Methanoperedens sp.]|nr:VIT1/CCC1 transporter family protein [Candidatus Methanoperedens sp.]
MMKFRTILSPSDRHSEILFGLIMVLAITGTVWLGTHSTKAIISAGIGACIAWGIVDGIIYVYSSLLERGRIALAAQEASTCTGEGCDLRTIKEELEGTIVDTLGEREKHEVAQHILMRLKPVENHTHATRDDIMGGIAAGMLVFVSGVPPLLPFIFLDGIWAMRLSSIIGFVMLYAIGYRWGGYVGRSRFWTGVTMMSVGIAITGVVIALGG